MADTSISMADALRREGGGTGLSYNELLAGGLTPLEAQTRLAGFTGAFANNAAKDFRAKNPEAFIKAGSQILNVPITDFMSGQIKNPSLPNGTAFTPTLQKVQENELLKGQQLGAAPTITAPQLRTPDEIKQQLAQAGIVDPEVVAAYLETLPLMQSQFVGQAAQADVQQGQVSELATITGQLERLLGGSNPMLSRITEGAKREVLDILGSRGLQNSSISGEAITTAIMNKAIPIAAQDAQTYFQMDMKNLDNRQQTALANTQLRQQALLTDVSIENATRQFNAANQIQRQQFTASLVNSIMTQNADRTTAVSQFNAGQANVIAAQNVANQVDIDKANKQMELAVHQFNADLVNQRQQFNANMAFAVEQSNTNWRRQINTQNTVTQNSAMQANVQNLFNLSANSLNNMWQMFRDEAYWAYQSAESQTARDFNASMAANNRKFVSRNDVTWQQQAGAYAAQMLL